MSDAELELLEAYLDGALGEPETQRVEHRIGRDADWARALDRLRAERALRRAAWASCEPEVTVAEGVARSGVVEAVRADRAARAARFARRASAVAAGLLLAFAGGWATRGYVAPAPAAAPPQPSQVALTDERGNIIAVQHFADPAQARQFAEDVARWQSTRHAEDTGDFSQTSDEF